MADSKSTQEAYVRELPPGLPKENVNPEEDHGERYGAGHLGDDRKHYVEPSPDLLLRRARALHPEGGHRIGGTNKLGMPNTHLVQAECRCGATVMVTPEYAERARCSSCIIADIEQKGTSRA